MIKKLWYKGFRNLKEQSVDLNQHSTVIWGGNNQGKTNFLEAILVLNDGKSPFEDNLKNVINFNDEEAFLGVDYEEEGQCFRLYVKIDKYGKKTAVLNEKKVRAYKGARNIFQTTLITSDIIKIFKENAEVRRKELDKFCGYLFSEYDEILKKYEKALKQKNACLKRDQLTHISLWNKQLIPLAEKIVTHRKEGLKILQNELTDLCVSLLPDITKKLQIVYKSYRLEGALSYAEELTLKLNDDSQKEQILGYSLVGPQRDDFDILINDKCLYRFFSKGINRIVAFLFSFSQLQYLTKKNTILPILLLDEPFAEVDSLNKHKLIKFLQNKTQIVYTSVHQEDNCLFENPKLTQMVKGELVCLN